MKFNNINKYKKILKGWNTLKSMKYWNICTFLKRGSITIAMALVTLLLWLWISGFSVPLLGETTILKYAEAIKAMITDDDIATYYLDETTFINIAYDKSLVPVNDEYGFPKGNIAITDREKLAQFLKFANINKQYKNILMDVYFDPEITTPTDSVLFSLIASTPRLFIPKHKDALLPDSSILHKAAYSDYQITVSNSDFQKYPLFARGELSLAAEMYQQHTKHKLCEGWITGSDNGRLMLKSMIPALTIGAIPAYNAKGEKVIHNLGEDILATDDEFLLNALLTNKNIIVGDLTEHDLHNTFKGEVSGPILHYDTFLSLCLQKHIISPWFIIILITCFSWMIYQIIYSETLIKVRSSYLRILITWISFSVILSLISLTTYYFFSAVFDVFITSTIFTCYQQIINILKKYGKLQNL